MNDSDFRLDEMARDAIRRSPYLSQKNLRLETDEGRIVLKGEVGTYYQKQMAQEALRHLEGVKLIDNHLEVHW